MALSKRGYAHTMYFSCCGLFTILSIQIVQSCSRFHKLSISMFCTTIMRFNCCKWFNEFFTFLWHFIVKYFSRFGFNKNCFCSNSCSRWVITNRGRNLVTDGSWWHTKSVSEHLGTNLILYTATLLVIIIGRPTCTTTIWLCTRLFNWYSVNQCWYILFSYFPRL